MKTNTNTKYSIDIYKLQKGSHEYLFDIDNAFFESIEQSLVEKGSLKAEVSLEKGSNMLQLDIQINGFVELICDRSLQPFKYKMALEEHLIFKYGEEYQELSEDMYVIPEGTQRLDLSQYLFEYIGLAIPMKKIHPDLEEEWDEEDDDWENEGHLVYSSEPFEDEEEDMPEDTNSSEDDIDPRWSALKKLKNDN